jgi:hypothetical protein
LARLAEVSASIVTRIEGGAAPRGSTIRKIERAFGLPFGTFAASRTAWRSADDPVDIRIIFPHTTMACPFMPIALLGDVPNASFASYAQESARQESDGSYEPQWFVPAKRRTETPTLRGHRKIRPFVSSTLKYLIDQRRADIMLAWNGVIASTPEAYKRYAQISIGLSALTCIYFGTATTARTSAVSAIFPVGLDDLVHRYVTAANAETDHRVEHHHSTNFKYHSRDLSDWNGVVAFAKQLYKDEGGLAFFAWDPYSSWIQDELRGQPDFKFDIADSIGLYSAIRAKWPVYTIMDVIARTDNIDALKWLDKERGRSDGFFGRLRASIELVKKDLNSEIGGPSFERIRTYLDMPAENTRFALRQIDFDVRFYD